jgi:hypothetical protein
MPTIGVSRQAMSNHLTCLRGCGLVVAVPEGRRVRYELADGHLAHALSDLLDVVLAVDAEACAAAAGRQRTDHLSPPNGQLPHLIRLGQQTALQHQILGRLRFVHRNIEQIPNCTDEYRHAKSPNSSSIIVKHPGRRSDELGH